MPNDSELNDEIRDLIQSADDELRSIPASPFSSNAYACLISKIGTYVSELITESLKVSKRHRADTVSAAHVEQASAYLVASTSSRLFRHLGTMGGILFGAGLSNILAMTIANQYTPLSTIISLALGIIGAFLIALHMGKD